MGNLPRVIRALSMLCFSTLVAAEARAQANPPGPVRPPQLDHRHQTGIAVMPGIGYRVIVPYKENIVCGDDSGVDSKRVCTNEVPFFLDVQGSFGVSARIDLIADLRFGIAKGDVRGVGRQFAFAPGVRFWLDQDVQLKFFTTVQALFDSTEQNQPSISNTDFGIRNSNGLMYDPIRNVGFYVQFGESIGFKRWFRIELDAGFGVQVRFP